jgi:hypothetical protein
LWTPTTAHIPRKCRVRRRWLQQPWREDRIDAQLDGYDDGVLFISGCVSNQGKFYPRFDAVVQLTASANVILERVASRESNAFGKRDSERDRILYDLANVEPLAARGCDG